ncbi:MAG: hypothetical protein HQM09_08450 [Candidatus Riflebacteria bacterium]|nr:hypothetical protein [Candidatus Riflebacteria bacterium]
MAREIVIRGKDIRNVMEKTSALLQQLPEGIKLLFSDVFIAVFVMVFGKIVAYICLERLNNIGINEYFRMPLDTSKITDEKQKGAADVISFFVEGSVWLMGACWIANVHENKEVSNMIFMTLGRLWVIAVLAGLTLSCGNLLAKGIMGIIRNSYLKENIDALTISGSFRGESFSDSIAKAIGAIIYCFVFMLVFLSFAETFHLTSTLAAMTTIWSLGIRLFSAGMAVFIGFLGVTCAVYTREQDSGVNAVSPVQNHARTIIIVVTTILAIDLISSASSTILWFTVMILLAVFLLPLKENIFDFFAGLFLSSYQVKQVQMNGMLFTIDKIGVLNCSIIDEEGVVLTAPNRTVFIAHFRSKSGTPA